MQNKLQVSRPTATRYLEALTEIGLMQKLRLGRESYYLNSGLIALLTSPTP